MIVFEELYKEFEATRDVCDFYHKYCNGSVSIRFLLIRSLEKRDLREIISLYSDVEPQPKSKFEELCKLAYNSRVSVEQLVHYIESKRSEVISKREKEVEGLSEVLSSIPVVNCGIKNDKIDDVVKRFARDKSIKTYDMLIETLDNSMFQRFRKYCLWSYYNQTANDIIELYVLRHPKIIPTLRKIHNIDFFINLNGDIIPFDLKMTVVSDEYFNLASKGIVAKKSSPDDYSIKESAPSELEVIREYYERYRKAHKDLKLRAPGKRTKYELISEIESFNTKDSKAFLKKITSNHQKLVPNNSTELKKLEWWNYKFQGERLFCNNNRFYIFLAYKSLFVDGHALKSKTTEIGKQITALLDSIDKTSIHIIKYHYDKEDIYKNDYKALSISTIYTE